MEDMDLYGYNSLKWTVELMAWRQMHGLSIIHLLIKNLLSAYSMLYIVLGAQNAAVNGLGEILSLIEL